MSLRKPNHGAERSRAFLALGGDGPLRSDDDLAEMLAEDYLRSATGGDDAQEETHEEIVDEEWGGPFISTSAEQEFGSTTVRAAREEDGAAEPEALPVAVGPLVQRPRRK